MSTTSDNPQHCLSADILAHIEISTIREYPKLLPLRARMHVYGYLRDISTPPQVG